MFLPTLSDETIGKRREDPVESPVSTKTYGYMQDGRFTPFEAFPKPDSPSKRRYDFTVAETSAAARQSSPEKKKIKIEFVQGSSKDAPEGKGKGRVGKEDEIVIDISSDSVIDISSDSETDQFE